MGYSLISERAHKALKRYRCIWCGESILIGTQYVREFSVYDGDTQKHKWHPECKGAAEDFFREEGEDEFAPWENERPLSHAELEYQSWDCSLLAQGVLALRGLTFEFSRTQQRTANSQGNLDCCPLLGLGCNEGLAGAP